MQSTWSSSIDSGSVNIPMSRRRRPVEAEARAVSVEGRLARPTNRGNLFWPDDGYTKADLVEYYRRIAPVIIPYLRDRAQLLHCHPDGIDGPSFFQKEVDKTMADWIATAILQVEGDERGIRYVVCQDEATLLYLASLGCVDINPWNSRVERLQYPDYLVLDLDPVEIPFAAVVDAARVIHEMLDHLGAASYCKTSGATGLHIYVPLGSRYTWKQTRMFAEIIARSTFARLPKTTSLERDPAKRRGKVYISCLRNRPGATVVAPYSLRPRPGAPVSTPLLWDEVTRSLDPKAFNIESIHDRLASLGDIFQPVLGRGIDMERCLEKLT